eukprot:5257128-Prymnesium_polylepis.1
MPRCDPKIGHTIQSLRMASKGHVPALDPQSCQRCARARRLLPDLNWGARPEISRSTHRPSQPERRPMVALEGAAVERQAVNWVVVGAVEVAAERAELEVQVVSHLESLGRVIGQAAVHQACPRSVLRPVEAVAREIWARLAARVKVSELKVVMLTR